MKKRILFVDDEPNIIQGLERNLRGMREEWEMEFTGSGLEALAILDQRPFDVVVSDMRMPEMDGAELFERIRTKHPQIIRIILSGHSDQEMIMRSVKSTHQFIAKPCDPAVLKDTITRAYTIRDLLINEKLKELVTGVKHLPSLPTLYRKIVRELSSPDVSVKRIGDLIAMDITMTAEVLKLVNSAYFSLPHRITSPQQAAALLGIDILKGLVLYIQIFSAFQEDPQLKNFPFEAISNHCIMVGNLAKLIADQEGIDKKISEDALIAGILHDLGKIIIAQVPEQYQQIVEYSKNNQCSMIEAEYQEMGASHAEIGAYLLGLWGNPDVIVEAIAFHHYPSKLENTTFSTLTAVHVANVLLIQPELTPQTTELANVDYQYLEALNLISKIPQWVKCCCDFKLKEPEVQDE